mgnify:CR=1 FL=1
MQLNMTIDRSVIGPIANLNPEIIARISLAMQEAAARVLQDNGFNISLENIAIDSVADDVRGFSFQGETLGSVESETTQVTKSESHQFIAKSFDPSGANGSSSVIDINFIGNQGKDENDMLVNIRISGAQGTIVSIKHFAGKDSLGLITSENMKAVSPAAQQIVFAGADDLNQSTIDYSTIPLPEVKTIGPMVTPPRSLGR